MKHKLTKYLSDGRNEKEFLDVFVLIQKFGKFSKGEIFEEFYTSGNRFYGVSSNLFDPKLKNGHTKIILGNSLKSAPICFLKKIKKEESMLYKLHSKGFEGLISNTYNVNQY